MSTLLKGLKKASLLTMILLVVCGLLYPLFMTGISQIVFPKQAKGSLVKNNGKIIGSKLIGQDFTDSRFMKCRPSAVKYNVYTRKEKESGTYCGVSSGSDNYAPTNPKLIERVKTDLNKFLASNPSVKKEDIPTDLLTASGSGLDPHISPASADVQIPALVDSTGLSQQKIKKIISKNTSRKFLGIFGEETVNVLLVNLDIAKAIGIL